MPELITNTLSAVTPAAPKLVSPGAGDTVDAHSLTFEWTESDADSYVLEVARDSAFAEVLCLVPAGNSTSVTIFDLFHPDGATYHWRVEALPGNGARSVSASRSFVAATNETSARRAPEKVRDAEQLRPPEREQQTWEEARPPYRTGKTTTGEMILALSVMVVSFVLMVAYMFYLSSQI